MVRLNGQCNQDKLARSIQAVVRRHEALNLRFSPDGSAQWRVEPTPLLIPIHDLSMESEETKESAIANIYKRVGTTPFDLTSEPLFRAELIKLTEDEHIIVFSCHHIVCDGWSWNVLLQEMGGVYAALVEDRPYTLDKTLGYSNYVMSELQRKTKQSVQESYQYWLNQFADLPPALDLPTDRPRPGLKSFAGGTVTYHFDPTLHDAIKRLAAAKRVSLFALLFSAFNTMLARLSGQNDLVVTVPAAGQLKTGHPTLVGYCVNLLPVRMQLAMDSSFEELLLRTRTTILDAYEHQDATYSGIVNRLGITRDLSRLPISEINFNMDRDDAGVDFGQLDVTVSQTPKEATFSGIFFNLNEESNGLKVDCDFNSAIFNRETIERWCRLYEFILEQVVAEPGIALSQISLLSDQDRSKIFGSWNQTQANYPREALIHQLFEEQALRTPEATAAIFPERVMTYRELRESANRLANYLCEQGVTGGSLVGIYMERTPEMLIGILAALIAGGAYVPLDPAYPKDRLAFKIEDSGLQLLLTTAKLVEALPKDDVPFVAVDTCWSEIQLKSDVAPITNTLAEDTAYVIYTSGSTGRPKGVMGLHRATVNRCQWMWDAYPFGENEVCCQKTSLNFVDSVWEIFGPLLQGVPCLYIPTSVVKQPSALIHALAETKVTRLVVVPSLLSALLDTYLDLALRLPDLKMWITSGEALTVELASHFKEQCPEFLLLNLYGSSEVAADVTYYEVDDPDGQSSIPIGKPISNAHIYLLDSMMQPVPIGVKGEIYVGGDVLAGGYLNRPDLTAERFVVNPFSTELFDNQSAYLYKTGDIGRYRSDGNIDYLGRTDHQIKIRGFRIELAEVESVLLTHPGVQQVVAMAHEERPAGARLVAYVVSNENAELLRNHCRQRLPDYMVPSYFVTLSKMPLTPNGKIDRLALQSQDFVKNIQQSYVAPRNEMEQLLVDLWEPLLNQKPIGINEDFFDLGGHSLLAVRFLARLRERTGDEIPLALLLERPTIAAIAAYLVDEASLENSETVPSNPPAAISSHLVCFNAGAPGTMPIFCIHGAGGNVLILRDLARYLGEEIPFYGIQARGVDGIERPHSSIEEMAKAYIDAIQTVHKDGPFVLAGYSGGGTVAYEMAQRLAKLGVDIPQVAFLDTFYPGIQEETTSISTHIKSFTTQGGEYLISKITGRLERQRIERERREKLEKLLATGATIPVELRDFHLASNFISMMDRYTPRPYNGQVLLFRAEETWSIYSHAGPDRGWSGLIPNLSIQEVPGDHETLILEPNVQTLADRFKRFISPSLNE